MPFYLLACLIVAWFGRNRLLRFWGTLILAIFATPLVTAIILLLGGPARPDRTKA